MGKIQFGTDGWRAVISEDFTFDNVKIVAQAVADYIKNQKSKIKNKKSEIYGKKIEMVVGYDTRFLSEKYAELVALVFAANGIKVILTDRPTPTPSVSFYIRHNNLIGGVMITASHNPARYNGIKYKGYFGGSVGSLITDKIESNLYKSKLKYMENDEAVRKGLLRIENIIPIHTENVKKYVDMNLLRSANLKILVDSMNGAGAALFEEILKNTNNKVTTINGNRDVYFGGRSPEPNEVQLESTSEIVRKGDYDVAIVTDGDSDRLGVILKNGKVVSGHKIITLLLLHLLEDRKMKGGVVQTICGTSLINKIAEKYNFKTYETAVGFKYISEIMLKEDILVGGEETGGIAFKGWVPERDALLSGLLMLEMIIHRKKNLMDILDDIDKEYGTFIYKRYDKNLPKEEKKKLLAFLKKKPFKEVLGRKIIDIKDYDGFKFVRDDGSWFMLRPSGTEPKLRIYSESPSESEAIKLIEFARKVVEECK